MHRLNMLKLLVFLPLFRCYPRQRPAGARAPPLPAELDACHVVRNANGQELASRSSLSFLLKGVGTRIGGSMWNERKMPERWHGLLRQRMQVEEQRMRVIKNGDIIEGDDLEQLMAEAGRLDREMLLVMRQAIAAALVREAA